MNILEIIFWAFVALVFYTYIGYGIVLYLMVKVKELEGKEGNAVKSHLRNWMSLLHDNEGMAKQKMNRLLSLYSGTKLETCIKEVTKWEVRANKRVCPVYDILTIHTINNQKTR